MILYKYTTSAGIRAIVKGASLLVRPVNEYNDPFEAVPAMSDDGVRKTAMEITRTGRGLQRYANDPTLNEERYTLSQLTRLVKNQTFLQKAADRIVRQSRVSPLEAAKNFQDYFSRFLGLVCLTKNPANFLMWSLYAEKHHGYVFSIDASLWNPDKEARKVTYSDQRVSLPNVQTATTDEFMPVFMTKSCDWKHEEEYRILCRVRSWKSTQEGKVDYLALKPNQIKWICSGLWTEGREVVELREALKSSKFPNAKVCQASLHTTQFRIDLPKECAGFA